MIESLRHGCQWIAGWVYPPLCGGCEAPLDGPRHRERPFLCEGCEEGLERVGGTVCLVCGQGYESRPGAAFRCHNCGDRELAIDFAVGAYRSNGPAREMMHALKYRRQIHLARTMGTLLAGVWREPRLRETEAWWLVPVPLHPRRQRKRGFNQSHEIAAQFIAANARLPGAEARPRLRLVPALKRTRHTERQARLDRKERFENPAGAFALRSARLPRSLPEGTGILVVDDVITTASTVSECAAVLRTRYGGQGPIAAISVLRG